MAIFGCIADDFTGASDAASFLVKGGMRVKLYNGIPENKEQNEDETQAIVIALKSRTQKTEDAVADSLHAADYLLKQGVKQLYFKYCSTFDSTPAGNIGPVADALMEFIHTPYTILCPALPVNGRTVEHGNLMVNGIPLHESHMKNHPLTPMWDCSIAKLMEPQSSYPCVNLDEKQLNPQTIDTFSEHYLENKKHLYIIPDYVLPEDSTKIASLFGHLPLLTGGSGLLEPLAKLWTERLSSNPIIPESKTDGKALILAGSCSKATLAQISWYQEQKKPCYKLDPKSIIDGHQTIDDIWNFIETHTTERETVLVYSSDKPEKVKEIQKMGAEKVASILESLIAKLAARAVSVGYTRIITAGGETSGAVTKGLGFSSYWIGESVAPGVPIMIPTEHPDIRLILKSGNFGQTDFFGRALALTASFDEELSKKLSTAVWAAHSLFARNKISGSSANMSFRHKNNIYITASGSCFGTLTQADFAVIAEDGTILSEKKPSKEWPLHLALFEKSPSIGAVLHTHSTYSVLWSLLPSSTEEDCIPDHTPYLKMKLGTIGLIPYKKPGSEELFQAFRERIHSSDGYILKNHGPVVPGNTIMDAFFNLEELEESSHIAWEVYRAGIQP